MEYHQSSFDSVDVKSTIPAWIGVSVNTSGLNLPDTHSNTKDRGLHELDIETLETLDVETLITDFGFLYIANIDG